MASVRINSGLHGGEEAACIPRHQWRDLVDARAMHCNSGLRQDCRALVFYLNDAAANDWLGFGGRDEYIRDGLRLDVDIVEWAVEGLRKLDGEYAVRLVDAVQLGRHGGDRRSAEAIDQGNNVTLIQRGNSETYTIARLRRDAPELADAVVRGELSANAAAIKAGFRKPTWTAPADPVRLADALQRRYPDWEFRRRC